MIKDSAASGDVSSRLADLRERFATRAAEDLQELERRAQVMREQGFDQAVMEDVCARLHRLAGSAGTFGFPELGEAARSLEKMLKAQAASGQGPVVSTLAVEKILALRTMLESPPMPVAEDEAMAETTERLEGSHGLRVAVRIVPARNTDYEWLAGALAAYGFDCRVMAGTDAEIIQTLATETGVATVILCADGRIAGIMEQLDASVQEPVRRMPLVCLSEDVSFDSRYQMAALGADGFFGRSPDLPELAERIEYLALERSSRVQGRVVLVEDDPELAEHYFLVLRSAGIDVCWVRDPMRLMSELSSFRPDILLMDVQLGPYSGVTLARMVRFDPQWLSLPIIYLSSEDNRDNQLEALSRGADEFLTKPVSDGYLVRAVRIRCFRARQLFRLMNRDSLTGLLKHSLIKLEAEKELARCRRDGHPASVVMVDLDHFKEINDTYGHRYGDMVIKALANTLRNRLRETDMIGRYGGEEFLVVLPHCDTEAARRLFTDIADAFSQLTFNGNNESFGVTLSAGVAAINNYVTGDDAVDAADQALYQRKRAGRNGVTVFGDDERNSGPTV
ncbi:diguanylate cyclase (GGDEF) domain-containing protein [Marinobacter persicus]|uniref:diguanylate cyclase n=1 Tax=Marinobacter persicus TaxID=930118 RepID=A0A1I3QIB5_9GAMM|nr:diguanylate cyclase [Marinobacter persicus]GHD42366.1 diguanylate cyclase response regulator [Marinobacter persicus]SFJ33269.1 diguanylate cyclase (GGDEF) domain-containing protein [Marinobacter persicus]